MEELLEKVKATNAAPTTNKKTQIPGNFIIVLSSYTLEKTMNSFPATKIQFKEETKEEAFVTPDLRNFKVDQKTRGDKEVKESELRFPIAFVLWQLPMHFGFAVTRPTACLLFLRHGFTINDHNGNKGRKYSSNGVVAHMARLLVSPSRGTELNSPALH
ncbi:hypothetical protein V6N11_030208 [Hibiscus sabdariffa]|uniref:Uncharacterized protein n=1 Tax=Hibiscus sabdariffa TaxID=183260 RepID=A0ABR2PKK0_9ROSI